VIRTPIATAVTASRLTLKVRIGPPAQEGVWGRVAGTRLGMGVQDSCLGRMDENAWSGLGYRPIRSTGIVAECYGGTRVGGIRRGCGGAWTMAGSAVRRGAVTKRGRWAVVVRAGWAMAGSAVVGGHEERTMAGSVCGGLSLEAWTMADSGAFTRWGLWLPALRRGWIASAPGGGSKCCAPDPRIPNPTPRMPSQSLIPDPKSLAPESSSTRLHHHREPHGAGGADGDETDPGAAAVHLVDEGGGEAGAGGAEGVA